MTNEQIIEKVLQLNMEQYEEIEKERAENLGNMIAERREIHPIYLSLRFFHGMLHLGPYLYGNKGRFELDIENDKIILNYISINKDERGKGYGNEYMEILTDLADKHQYKIELQVKPEFGTSAEVLYEFYENHGFESTVYDYIMVREPNEMPEGDL